MFHKGKKVILKLSYYLFGKILTPFKLIKIFQNIYTSNIKKTP